MCSRVVHQSKKVPPDGQVFSRSTIGKSLLTIQTNSKHNNMPLYYPHIQTWSQSTMAWTPAHYYNENIRTYDGSRGPYNTNGGAGNIRRCVNAANSSYNRRYSRSISSYRYTNN